MTDVLKDFFDSDCRTEAYHACTSPVRYCRIEADVNVLVALCPNGDEVFVWFAAPRYCALS